MESVPSESSCTGMTVLPGWAVSGTMHAPGSKSLAQRCLLAAFLAEGQTRVRGVPACQDVEGLLGALRGLAGGGWGQDGTYEGGAWTFMGPEKQHTAVRVGESGTCARLLTACVALGGHGRGPVHIIPEGSLGSRTSPALVEALKKAGACISSGSEGGAAPDSGWPMIVIPVDCPAKLTLLNPSSSQEVSALLFALAAKGGGILSVEGVLPSEPYIRMTQSVLGEFGVEVAEVGGQFTVAGTMRAPAHEIVVEPDASAAAVLLAAGCLSGGTVQVPGLTSRSVQGDLRIIEHLRAFGCRGKMEAQGLRASGIPCRGAEIDLVGEPDLAPVLAVVGAMACYHSGEPALLKGLGTLEGKESPRLSGLANTLGRMGWEVRTGPDWLGVDAAPVRAVDVASPMALDPEGDHRMAFAYALLGLGFSGVRITGAACVGKSYPNFWTDLVGAGANIQG